MEFTVPTDQSTVVVTHRFNSAPVKVFEAFTEPKKLEQWWIGPGVTMRVETLEAIDGGSWRFVQQMGNGQTHTFFGIYHEVSKAQIIRTQEYLVAGQRGHVVLERTELIPQDPDATVVKITFAFFCGSDRDAMITQGMEQGTRESLARLDQFLREQGAPT